VTFDELVIGLKSGDAKAFRVLVDTYFGLLFYLARHRVATDAEAEDVVQDLLLKIYANRVFENFKGTTESEFKSFLARIAIHTIYDHHRRVKQDRERLVVFDPENTAQREALAWHQTPESEFERNELAQRVQAEIDALPEDYAQVINLKLLGYSQTEIAEVVEKPLGTVASWTARALEILKKNLADLQVKR